MTYVLWIIQILLGLLFLFAGGSKLVMSIEVMQDMAREAGQSPLPGMLLRFIGVAELLGGLGLILPGLIRIRPGLTPLAAAGLLIIMIGAVVITVSSGPMAPALFPLIVCLLLIFVIYGRTKLAPIAPR